MEGDGVTARRLLAVVALLFSCEGEVACGPISGTNERHAQWLTRTECVTFCERYGGPSTYDCGFCACLEQQSDAERSNNAQRAAHKLVARGQQ